MKKLKKISIFVVMVYDMMQIFADHIFLQKLQVFASFVAMVFQSLLRGIRKIEQEDCVWKCVIIPYYNESHYCYISYIFNQL